MGGLQRLQWVLEWTVGGHEKVFIGESSSTLTNNHFLIILIIEVVVINFTMLIFRILLTLSSSLCYTYTMVLQFWLMKMLQIRPVFSSIQIVFNPLYRVPLTRTILSENKVELGVITGDIPLVQLLLTLGC